MILRLDIARFKSIRELSLECRRVNVFVGPPDTGKTNVLEALHLLSLFGWDWPIGASLRLREELGFDPLFYRQFFDEPIRIELTLDPPMRGGAHLSFKLGISGQQRLLSIESQFLRGVEIPFNASLPIPSLAWLRYYSYAGSEAWQYATGYPEGTQVITPPHGANLAYIARHNAKAYDYLKDIVASLGWKLRFDQNLKVFRMSEVRENEILDYNLDLLSDSLKRLFFYATILRTSENATLVFDEPDVFAFPPYPKTLGDLIAADESNQYFLSTHNPYFLGSLVEKTAAKHLAVFVCSRDEEGGTTARLVPPTRMNLIVEHGANVFFNLDELLEP